MHLPEELEQLPIRRKSRIKAHAHDLRMAGAPSADVLIRWRWLAPTHVAHGGLHHPRRLPEASLSPPEASRCEVARLNHWCIVPYLGSVARAWGGSTIDASAALLPPLAEVSDGVRAVGEAEHDHGGVRADLGAGEPV